MKRVELVVNTADKEYRYELFPDRSPADAVINAVIKAKRQHPSWKSMVMVVTLTLEKGE